IALDRACKDATDDGGELGGRDAGAGALDGEVVTGDGVAGGAVVSENERLAGHRAHVGFDRQHFLDDRYNALGGIGEVVDHVERGFGLREETTVAALAGGAEATE